MPRLRTHRFNYNGHDYEIEFNFDDAAIVEDQISIDSIAKARLENDEDGWESVLVNLSYKIGDTEIVVSLDDGEIGRIKIEAVDITEEMDSEEAWGQIEEFIDAAALEAAIGLVPTDPIIGCLAKAGISSVAGQLVRCINESKQSQRRARAIFRCLGQNVPGIAYRAVYRAIRCMLLAGFG